MFELSPFVTAMKAPASRIPAASRVSRSNTIPTSVCPSKPGGSRSNAVGFLSMIEMVCPWRARFTVSWLPTRPHPAMTTCMGCKRTTLLAGSKSPRSVQVERHARDDGSRLEQQRVFDRKRSLVVKGLMPPPLDDEFRNDHRHDCIGHLCVQLVDVTD